MAVRESEFALQRPGREPARSVDGRARDAAEHDGLARPAAPISDAESPARLWRRESRLRRLLGAADVLAGGLALALGVTVLGDDALRPAALLGLPIIVLLSKLMGLYDRDESLITKTTLDEAPAVFVLATLYTLTVWLFNPLLIDGALSRGQIVGLWGTLFALTLLFRSEARMAAGRLSGPERCVAIGDPAECRQLSRKLSNATTARLVGTVLLAEDDAPAHSEHEVVARSDRFAPALTEPNLRALSKTLRELEADRVVIAARHPDTDDTLEVVRTVKSMGIRVSVVPRVFDIVGSSVESDQVEGLPVLGVRRFGITRSSRFVKRAFDVLGSSALLLVSAPVLAMIGIAIKLDSRGPILFRQTRVGRGGRHFQMVKFRTMHDGADGRQGELMGLNEADGGIFKIADDPRVTRVGRILRRSSIDELPQLWNVLRGEMSLVGPRPLPVDEDAQIGGWDRRRLHLTPGMTGPWQVLGAARIPLGEMVKIDYLYVANWSLWNDVKILLRTVLYVIGARGQ
jgi:exopolysaccharide biosynthesis polyprenyl glycosylphosphotransferase